MDKNAYNLEIQIENVTPSQFLAYVRRRCREKNVQAPSISSTKEFANCEYASMGDPSKGHDGWSADHWHTKPYDYQVCSIRKDHSTGFNEICEFTFDDEKKGHGYYYSVGWG